MKPILFFCTLFVYLGLNAQNEISNAYAKDSHSVQSLIDAYYDCISGPIGEVRDFERLKYLFHSEARLVYSYWNEDSSKAQLMLFNTVDDFISKLGYLDKKGFYEHEISNRTHSFSTITQVFSTYEFNVEDKSVPTNKGITSYEVFFDGERYWILSMFWVAENEAYQIPKKYLSN
jgi:hypothetical protein